MGEAGLQARWNFLSPAILWELGQVAVSSIGSWWLWCREQEELIFFVGEADYQEELEKRAFKLPCRSDTVWYLIRWFGKILVFIEIWPAFPPSLYQKVLIMGSASNGTDLGQGLNARYYDTPVSLEYRNTRFKIMWETMSWLLKTTIMLLGQYVRLPAWLTAPTVVWSWLIQSHW